MFTKKLYIFIKVSLQKPSELSRAKFELKKNLKIMTFTLKTNHLSILK